MAILSGIGAVMTPYTQLNYFLKDVTKEDIQHCESKLLQNTELIISKKKQLFNKLHKQNSVNEKQNSKWWLFGKYNPFSSEYKDLNSVGLLNEDINSLVLISKMLFLELDELNLDFERVQVIN